MQISVSQRPLYILTTFPARGGGIGHNQSDPWEEFSVVPLHRGYHPTLVVPAVLIQDSPSSVLTYLEQVKTNHTNSHTK